MKILLYSPVFHPMVGGVESVTATLAALFTELGHECSVLTPIENPAQDNFNFRVYRNPSLATKLRLVAEADVVLSKTAALAILPFCLLTSKPLVWVHSGYQASCVDGLGWVDGDPAPLTPKESIAFHFKRSGLLYAARSAAKLYLRRFACRHLVAMNVAVSDWVAMRQPFKRQITIHNPFPLEQFTNGSTPRRPRYDFLYLGRLVSEKGVETLIKAFDIVVRQNESENLRLLIIGDGSWRPRLELLASQMELAGRIEFAGKKTGKELATLVHQCKVAVVPSEWEEPMGGVAVELLAAGLPVIVSKNGGLAECIGDAGLTFENGNHHALAHCMTRLLKDERLKGMLLHNAKRQVEDFNPRRLATQYLKLFDQLLDHSNALQSHLL